MWFMALQPTSVRQYLDRVYNNRWISRAGIQPWSPRSSDLNPLDYFLWGHLKSLVYTTPIENENDLRNRIVASCEAICTPNIFERVCQSVRRRLDVWRKVDIFNNSSNCFISSEELKPVFVFLFLISFWLVQATFLSNKQIITTRLNFFISETKPFRTHVYMDFFTWNKPKIVLYGNILN